MADITDRSLEQIKQELRELLIENLNLEDIKPGDIGDDDELFGQTGLGLDSLDGVEIVVILQRHYGIDIKNIQKGREVFRSLNTLAPYVKEHATK